MKVIKIIEDNAITGVRYGAVEVQETPIKNTAHAKKTYATAQAIKAKRRSERTKQK